MRATKKNNLLIVYATLVNTLVDNVKGELHPQYYEYKDVFDEKNTNILLKHQPYNYPIEQ